MAVLVNLIFFGLFSPFAASLMDLVGMRKVVAVALTLVALGSGLVVFMTAAWQLLLLWGVVVGLGTGSMSMAFVATFTSRWFVARKGLVAGILTASTSTGQLIFLPLIAHLTMHDGWCVPSVTVALAALVVVPCRCCCCVTTRTTSGSSPMVPPLTTRPRPRSPRPAAAPGEHCGHCPRQPGSQPSGC